MQILVSIGLKVEELAWLKKFENFGTQSYFSSCVTDSIFLVVHMIFWLSNTFIKIKFWVVILQDKIFPGSMM